jgi:thiosulfate dehydrogenase [quinone] large subunit
MNWHFVMAGAASTNAMLALVGVLLVLAWRTAVWWGLDRWLLARLGVRRVPSTG